MSKSDETTPQQPIIDFWQLFRGLPEPYLLFEANDPVYTIVDLNKERERVTGVKRAQAVGKPLFEIYPDVSDEFRKTGINPVHERIKAVLKTGKPALLNMRYDLKLQGGKAKERYWQSTYMPLSLNGPSSHILAITKDVSGEQSVEKRVAKAEQQLEAALSIGKVGSWAWDVQNDKVVADTNLARMFGIHPRTVAEGLPLRSFLAAIHDEDRPRVDQAIKRALKEKSSFEQEYRTFTNTGEQRWVLARGKVEERDHKLFFPGVVVDITERRDLQAQVELAHQQDKLNRQAAKILQDRNEELEAISRTKDEFVALASHQLRTPATAVKQYVGMVLQGYVGDISDMQTDMLEKAFESNERQIQIINQILNAARVDTGRLVMTSVSIDLRALLQGIAADMHASFEQRGHTFTMSLPKQPVPVMADLGYLRMAIENVLHNASIYTPEGGTISVKLEKQGKHCRLSITDTGVGIKKADLGKLFAKFSRIHNPLSVQAGGSGIGLYLTAEIVRLHNGSVSVESKIRRGTTFAILLPLAQNMDKPERSS